MKLTVPLLEITEDEGFSEKDIFKRKEFGERLANLVESSDGELVIALDAPWGEGKSTFIKMWQGHLKKKDNGVHTIYFNAFENDHQNAPFLALASEIYNLIDVTKKAEKPKFEKKVLSALKTTGRIGLRIGTKLLIGSALDETVLDPDTKKEITKEAANAMDSYMSTRLKSVAKDKIAIKQFKEYLEKLPQKLSKKGKSIVFIIDELDRCKPPFALEIVEVVKHLFSVPNITFILVMNRTQLEASVIKEYGTSDPSKYLQKFINLWISLPKVHVSDERTTKVYLRYCAKQMGMESQQNFAKDEWMGIFEELGDHYDLSLRDMERALTNVSFIRRTLTRDLSVFDRWIAVYLSIIKVIYTQEYNLLATSKIEYTDLFTKTRLTDLADGDTHNHFAEKHILKWVLRYCLIDERKRRSFMEGGIPFGLSVLPSRGKNSIQDICQLLDSLRIN